VNPGDVSKALAELQKTPAPVASSIVTPSVQMPVNNLPVSQGITGGTLLHSVQPTYPDSARRQKIQGEVVLEAVVDTDGAVRDLTLVNGDPILASAAKQAVAHWRYAPYLLNGKPVSMRTNIRIRFTLLQ
jgi:protein TonB